MKEHLGPQKAVMQTTSTEGQNRVCALDSESFRTCLYLNAFNWEIGWELIQDWEDDVTTPDIVDGYYSVDFTLFSNQKIQVIFDFFMERLWDLNVEAIFEEFKLKLIFNITYYYDSRLTCLYSKVFIDNLKFETKGKQALFEAEKNVLLSPWTLDNWTGPYAVWFDRLALSDMEQVELYKYEILQNNSEIFLYGSAENNKDKCLGGYLWQGQSPFVAEAYHNLFTYMFADVEPKSTTNQNATL